MVMGLVFSKSFWLRVLPGGAHLVQPRWMPERGILGGGRTGGVSFWPFPNSSGWWWLISSVFLTRTSCHKTTHANGYYGAWPGWAVSVIVLPLTVSGARHQHTLSMNGDCQANLISLFQITSEAVSRDEYRDKKQWRTTLSGGKGRSGYYDFEQYFMR